MLPDSQVAEGTAIIIFVQTFGGAIFVSVAQSVFNNQLVRNVVATGLPINPGELLSRGATQLATLVSSDQLPVLKMAYNKAITQVCAAFSQSISVDYSKLTGPSEFLRRCCYCSAQYPGQCFNPLVQRQEETGREGCAKTASGEG